MGAAIGRLFCCRRVVESNVSIVTFNYDELEFIPDDLEGNLALEGFMLEADSHQLEPQSKEAIAELRKGNRLPILALTVQELSLGCHSQQKCWEIQVRTDVVNNNLAVCAPHGALIHYPAGQHSIEAAKAAAMSKGDPPVILLYGNVVVRFGIWVMARKTLLLPACVVRNTITHTEYRCAVLLEYLEEEDSITVLRCVRFTAEGPFAISRQHINVIIGPDDGNFDFDNERSLSVYYTISHISLVASPNVLGRD